MTARLTFVLMAVLMACALAVVTSQHKARKLYQDLQKEQAAAKQIEVEWGQLQLEQGTWATHARIEKMAVRQLNMQVPAPERVEVVAAQQRTPQP